ncbi:Pentatricopeptide repeat-containing protein [Acorus gramineus]|uniref:Pentatricopeptide repeat-containing protein n=1 Tax=Acorus gramineus TaxID=55184 RepID=A0AAV9AGW8_ACOGR|nr:Pentatricopeptide repeat-containing protein [Acorus gramineus]
MIQRPLSKHLFKTKPQLFHPHKHLSQAHHLFDETPTREEPLNLSFNIHRSNAPIEWSTISTILTTSASSSDAILGRQAHAQCVKQGFIPDIDVTNSLLNMYMKCHRPEDATTIFESTPVRNSLTWASLIRGYAINEKPDLVLESFFRMRCEGFAPNPFMFAAVFAASAARFEPDKGIRCHGISVKCGYESFVLVCNSMITMYLKFGLIERARSVFAAMGARDSVSWNSMIAGLAHNGFNSEAVNVFLRMQRDGDAKPTQSSFATVIKLCGNLDASSPLTRQLHCAAEKSGVASFDNVATALIVAYGKRGETGDAFKLFDSMPGPRSVVSWTAMIDGCLKNCAFSDAEELFVKMRRTGEARPNHFTYSAVLLMVPPSQVHALVVKANCEGTATVSTALLTAYVRRGDASDARAIFRRIRCRDIVAWSAMMMGYAQTGDSDGAVELFKEMLKGPIVPNEFTFSSVINACASPTAAIEQGKQFHAFATKCGQDSAVCVSSAIVTMYVKRGCINDADRVFAGQMVRDIVSWNSIVSGYAQHGDARKALDVYSEMRARGFQLDSVTFIGVICACVHAGLVGEGQRHFDSMVGEDTSTIQESGLQSRKDIKLDCQIEDNTNSVRT